MCLCTGSFQKGISFRKANSLTRQLLQVPSTTMTSEEGVEKVTISIKNIFGPQTVLLQKTNIQIQKRNHTYALIQTPPLNMSLIALLYWVIMTGVYYLWTIYKNSLLQKSPGVNFMPLLVTAAPPTRTSHPSPEVTFGSDEAVTAW